MFLNIVGQEVSMEVRSALIHIREETFEVGPFGDQVPSRVLCSIVDRSAEGDLGGNTMRTLSAEGSHVLGVDLLIFGAATGK